VHLTALADAAVVPSIFPEAFGMVAAEAAAAGCPPVVARHSGLAEIAEGLETTYPEGLGRLASFPNEDSDALADRLNGILALSDADRDALRVGARKAAVELWSWTSVADRILAASFEE
jgi:glycosyltransferase involved in cell wall biosynthesis